MPRAFWSAALVWLLLSLPGWSRDWQAVESFAYQLQNIDLKVLAQSDYDLVVVDYSSDGSAAGRFDREQIASLQQNGKLVLAYLSIGEAEDYRFYWRPEFKPGQPAWLVRGNDEWDGNFRVEYWHPQWQAIVFEYLDQILEAGFDGVFLDVVDVYEDFSATRPQARQEMISLVQEIARRSREQAGPDFGVFPQNAEELLADSGYLETITGIAKEDTYFGYPTTGEPSDAAWTAEVEALLAKAVKADKLVLNVDYPSTWEQASAARERAEQNGYLEFIAARELDVLTVALEGVPPEIALLPSPSVTTSPTPVATPVEEEPRPGTGPTEIFLVLLVLGVLVTVVLVGGRRARGR